MSAPFGPWSGPRPAPPAALAPAPPRRCRLGERGRAAAAALALAAASTLAGCRPDAAPSPDAVAEIAGAEVDHEAFAGYVERQIGERGSALHSDVLSGLFDRFVDERLLAALAAERGLVPAGITTRRAVERLLETEGTVEPAEEEVAAYYEEHRDEFRRPERVRLRQALFEDRATAERAREEIAAGAAFAEVARRLSRDPTAAAGGLQGELAREELPSAFAEAIFRLARGEVSPVVEAEYGFHLFQVDRRLPAAEVPLAEAREEIAGRLRRESADARLAGLVEEARGRYNATVFVRNLPFNYQGRYLAESR